MNDSELAYLPIGLTELLKVQITDDHKAFWRFTADVINELGREPFSPPEELLDQFELLLALVLGTPVIDHTPERWSNDWIRNEILWESSILASYAGFPILEGFLKSVCSEYVKQDGTVRPGKTVQTYTGPLTENDRCTSIGHLLYHLENEAAGPDLAKRMEMMRERVASFYKWNEDEVYGTNGLSGLRNSWLHGKEEADAENGIILNYISILIWDEISENM